MQKCREGRWLLRWLLKLTGRRMSVHNDVCGCTTLYGEGNSMVLNLVQELWLDVTRFAAYFRLDKSFVLISYNSLCSKTSTIHLPAPSPFFLVVMEKKGLAICLSLVSYQKGTWCRAFFFFRKVESWKRFWAAEKKTLAVAFKKMLRIFFY